MYQQSRRAKQASPARTEAQARYVLVRRGRTRGTPRDAERGVYACNHLVQRLSGRGWEKGAYESVPVWLPVRRM